MTTHEIEAIKQSMSDGYFQKDGKHPSESETSACLRFFEVIDIMKKNKTSETLNESEEALISLFNMIMDRKLLIVNFDIETNVFSFVVNNITFQ